MSKPENEIRVWRIQVKSDDGTTIRYDEPFTGPYKDALRRAWIMWARTSYIVNKFANQQNRDVYASLEVWDVKTRKFNMVKDKRGRLPRNAKAPAAS